MRNSNRAAGNAPLLQGIASAAKALAVAAFMGSLLLTVWLYGAPNTDSIPLLLLELGPRWVLALGFLPLLLVPMTWRRRATVAAIALGASVALVDLQLWSCMMPASSQSPTLRVGTYNTGGGFVPPTELLLWYDEQDLDVLLMQELGKPERLRAAAETLGMQVVCASKLCALTQHQVSGELALDRRDLGGWGGYAARFELCAVGSCWPLVNVHLATPRHAIEEILGREPWSKARGLLRARALESSLASLVTQDPRAVIAGDFNMTQQSPLYREHWSGWQNAFASAGCGFGYSKYTTLLETRIDHILPGGQWKILSSRNHDSLGGDHRPVTTALALRSKA